MLDLIIEEIDEVMEDKECSVDEAMKLIKSDLAC
jgi:hypothetical protein